MITRSILLGCLFVLSLLIVTSQAEDKAPRPCMPGWTQYNGSCYFLYGADLAKPRTQAAETCYGMASGWYIHLASFHDKKEYDWAYDWMKTQSGYKQSISTWIGLTFTPKDQWEWHDNKVLAYEGWAPEQPNGNGVCACIRRDTGGYNDHNCSFVKQFLCEYELSGLPPRATVLPSPCPQGWGYHDFSCYKFADFNIGRNYSGAEYECSKLGISVLGHNAKLADIQTQSEYVFAYSFLEAQKNFHIEIGVWIGLRLIDNTWVWSDGKKLDYDTWATDEPNGNGPCGSIHKQTGGYNDSPCQHTKQYLCEFELKRATTEPPPKQPGGTCDPEWVHEEMSCYRFFGRDTLLPREKALTYCKGEFEGAHLADLQTIYEYEWIMEAVKSHPDFDVTQDTWIGLMRKTPGDMKNWIWSDGTPLIYNSSWARDNPSSKTDMCGSLHRMAGGLNDHGCNNKEQFICEYELPEIDSNYGRDSTSKDFIILAAVVLALVVVVTLVLLVRGYRKYCRKNDGARVKYSGIKSDRHHHEPDPYVDIRITENPRESPYRDDINAKPYRDLVENI